MAKTKAAKRRRSRGFTIPVAVIGGFIPLLSNTMGHYKSYGWNGASRYMTMALTGFDPQDRNFNFGRMGMGLFPIMGGILVHKLVGGRLGVNRMLASTGLPWVRL